MTAPRRHLTGAEMVCVGLFAVVGALVALTFAVVFIGVRIVAAIGAGGHYVWQ